MASVVEWRDSGGVLLTASLAFSGDPGTPGTAVQFQLTNNLGGAGADPIANARLRPEFRMVGDTAFVGAGIPVADRRMVQMRIVSGINLTAAASEWKSVGAGATLPIPTVSNNEGLVLEARANIPADQESAINFEISLALEVLTAQPGPDGISDTGGDGIYVGYRDAGQTVLVSGAAVVENPGGADTQVQVGPFVGVISGTAVMHRATLVTLTAAAAAKARYVLLTLAADGSVTETDGAEVTPPLAVGDKPVAPAGEPELAFVARDDSAIINTADVEDVYELGFYPFSSTGLTATIGAGPRALVDSAVCSNQAPQNVTLTASVTNSLWLQRDGTIGKSTDGVPPGDRSLLIYEAVTDGSGVTTLRDYREFTGAKREFVRFEWRAEVAIDDWRYATLANRRPAQLSPLTPLVFSLGSQGSGTGAQTRAELQVRYAGTWTSLAAVAADRPTIAYNAGTSALYDASKLPDRFDLPAYAQLRARISEIPTGSGGVEPNDAALTVEVFS